MEEAKAGEFWGFDRTFGRMGIAAKLNLDAHSSFSGRAFSGKASLDLPSAKGRLICFAHWMNSLSSCSWRVPSGLGVWKFPGFPCIAAQCIGPGKWIQHYPSLQLAAEDNTETNG